jgi:membrane-bound lytic murein transglycosylase MltF
MELTTKQIEMKTKIDLFAKMFGIDPAWAVAVAMTESSLGKQQLSPTGCRGVFQMSSIAMKDLLLSMSELDDDLVDIVCGIAFLRLLLKRHGTVEAATKRFCDPADKGFYWDRVQAYMRAAWLR